MNNKIDRTEKEYTFWLHYNQPESKKKKKPQMTIHYQDTCYFVNNIICNTFTFGYIKDKQPRWVIKGKTNMFFVDRNGTAHIENSNSDASSKVSGYVFSFYYNKSESNRVGKPQINIIYRGVTYIVDNIYCTVPIWTETKKMHYTLNGKSKSIKIIDNIAYVE